MKTKHSTFLLLFSALLFINWNTFQEKWIPEKHSNYTIFYTSNDIQNKKEYNKLVESGIISVKKFFNSSYSKKFNVYIHPNRKSLDSTWQKDWNMPDFKSECWMVASGVGTKLDVISPKLWDKEACEHIYSQTTNTQQLITHELVHVYHGQLNTSPDFSNVEGIDWFVEGLATFASGQCDSTRIKEVKKAINENKIPKSLDDFWTGKIKYGLSGSVVMFIDHKYGRLKLKEILETNKKTELLSILRTTEPELLEEWKKYIQSL
ncbi:hypothetical protein [Flavobacterium sp. N3904]|uniref:hypothetical protein n=1 Tax=Flavobacterium sp. N3904 TaxID=2986835 RepID=UPI002224D3AA|nr:hypothetical protein [Flavobacterium sp. N3904]